MENLVDIDSRNPEIRQVVNETYRTVWTSFYNWERDYSYNAIRSLALGMYESPSGSKISVEMLMAGLDVSRLTNVICHEGDSFIFILDFGAASNVIQFFNRITATNFVHLQVEA
jgi:hypothetical protein